MHSKDLPLMFLPRLYRKLIQPDIKQLYRPIARGDNQLVLMRFRPREVVKRILRVEPRVPVIKAIATLAAVQRKLVGIPFLNHDPLGRQTQDKQAPVAHKAKVRRCGDGEARVEVWRVFHSVAIEALSAEL